MDESCLAEGVLEDIVRAKLPAPERASAWRHIGDCPVCRSNAIRVIEDVFGWAAIVSAP